MSSTVRNIQSEESQLRSYLHNLKQKYANEKRDIEARGTAEIDDVITRHEHQVNGLKQAYDVQISELSEGMEAQLHALRKHNQLRIEEEKTKADTELEKMRLANQKRLAEYKKNADVQLEDTRREYQTAITQAHEQGKRALRKTEIKNA